MRPFINTDHIELDLTGLNVTAQIKAIRNLAGPGHGGMTSTQRSADLRLLMSVAAATEGEAAVPGSRGILRLRLNPQVVHALRDACEEAIAELDADALQPAR